MGTRADFYIKEDGELNWLGSIAWGGYPEGIHDDIFKAKNKADYLDNLRLFFVDRNDLSTKAWPWPWDNSNTTDFAYIFTDGKVVGSCFGSPVFDPLKERPEEDPEDGIYMDFPDMSEHKKVAHGVKSGLIVIEAGLAVIAKPKLTIQQYKDMNAK